MTERLNKIKPTNQRNQIMKISGAFLGGNHREQLGPGCHCFATKLDCTSLQHDPTSGEVEKLTDQSQHSDVI
jgi:hypothetical protein